MDMLRSKLRLAAPVVVTIGMLAACGGAKGEGPDGPTHNPPAPDSQEHNNPPAPGGTADPGTPPVANPPGHPEGHHNNPPAPGTEETEPAVLHNPPPPAPEK